MSTKIGEFKVDFELYKIGDTIKAIQKFDGEIKKAADDVVKSEEKVSKSTDSWMKSFSALKTAGVAAFGALYYQALKVSPAIQAHMTSIGIAMQMIGMEVGDAMEPLFDIFEELAWIFSDWFGELDEGTKKAIAYTAAIGTIAAAGALLGGPWVGLAVAGIGSLAVAYAEDFGNIQTNIDQLWKDIKNRDWEAAWDTAVKTVSDITTAIVDIIKEVDWAGAWDTMIQWFDDTAKISGKLGTAIGSMAANIANWLADFIIDPEFGNKIESAFEKAFEISDATMKIIATGIVNALSTALEKADWSKIIFAIIKGIAIIPVKIVEGIGNYILRILSNTFDGKGILGLLFPVGIGQKESEIGRQSGGYIPTTGMYNMHAGEQVIPSTGRSSGGTSEGINITNNMVFYGGMGDKQGMTQNVNDMMQTMKNSLRAWQSTGIGGRF